MMRFFSLFYFFCIHHSFSQDEFHPTKSYSFEGKYFYNDLISNSLKGSVKSIKIKYSPGKELFGEIIKDESANRIQNDLSGDNLTENFVEFNKEGFIIREYSQISKNGIPYMPISYKYVFNEKNKVVKKTKIDNPSFMETWDYKYNSNDSLIEIIHKDFFPNSQEKTILINGNFVANIIDDLWSTRAWYKVRSGEKDLFLPPMKTKFIYDNNQNLIMVLLSDSSGKVESKKIYIHEDRKIRYNFFLADKLRNDEEIIYDTFDNIIETNNFVKEEKIKFVYNEKNQLIQTRSYSLVDGKIKSQSDFSYDSNNNWIKEIKMEKLSILYNTDLVEHYQIIEREIKYF